MDIETRNALEEIPQHIRPQMDIVEMIYKFVVDEEGGWVYTDRADDPDVGTFGGMRWATYNTYSKVRGMPEMTPADFKNFCDTRAPYARAQMIAAYAWQFVEPLHIMQMAPEVRAAVFSLGVNRGQRNAVKVIQRVCNLQAADANKYAEDAVYTTLQVDGAWGRKTAHEWLMWCNPENVRRTLQLLCQEWMRDYINVVQANTEKLLRGETPVVQARNLEGWYNRVLKHMPEFPNEHAGF